MIRLPSTRAVASLLVLLGLAGHARAAEHVTLRNGFGVDCARQEPFGDRVRLYLLPAQGASGSTAAPNYIEVGATQIIRTEWMAEPIDAPQPAKPSSEPQRNSAATSLTPAELHEMLASAGTQHNVDADLLASVLHAESGGHVHATSRAGAQGLMQLMPSTAAELGVTDTFAPSQNIGGGTAYLDRLLTRYHDNLALALAAYNAGPAAVDRYRGVPPFAETRAYVSRVIREFNRRKRIAMGSVAALQPGTR
ncbi:MAG: hypothetical protein NVSMB62_02350 [Acidobacteriaceae bacterium]